MDLIEEKLWLGNISSATDDNLLRENKIQSIITIEIRPIPTNGNVNALFIKAMDDSCQDLISFFDEVYNFIEEGKQKGGVLVHCFHGVSRSASLVISYLQRKHSICRDEALRRVQSVRPSVMPNDGFMAQLLVYQEHLTYGTFVTPVMRWYHLQNISRIHFKSESDLSGVFTQKPQMENAIKCKNCRCMLFDFDDILQHHEGKRADWKDPSWVKSVLENRFEVGGCRKGIFVIPSAWMKPHSSPQGKLLCPKCRNKLGSFSWNQPINCCCGSEFQPAFHIVPSKVDLPIKRISASYLLVHSS